MTNYPSEFLKIAEFIKQNDDFLVTTHFNPDGDAIGCCLGFGELLKTQEKKFCVSIEGGLPEKYDFLRNKISLIDPLAIETKRKYENLVVLDAGSLKRIGRSADLVVENASILNIDHHLSNGGFGNVCYVDVTASSVSEIIYRLACYLEIAINPDMASYLYIGIMTDTGRFRFSNTTPSALRTCAELIEAGADAPMLTEALYFDLPRSYIEALGKSLSNLNFIAHGQLAMMEYLEPEEIEDAEGLIDFAVSIKGVKVAVFIRSMPDGRFKVSLRAREEFDVRRIAEAYGGGGHTKAAGFRYRGSLDNLKFDLIKDILSRFEEK
jgi:phosphoesterase RecJ-like protein